MKRRAFFTGSAALMFGGCALGSRTVQPALYDFGIELPPTNDARVESRIGLAEVSANPWLQTSAIMYRLTYRDAAQLLPYSLSRWAAPPAELILQRLRFALARAARNGFSMVSEGLRADYLLRVHLETFEQVVDAPTRARGVARMRARLSRSDRGMVAQHLFQDEEPCPSIDAAGSVHALAAAADRMVAETVSWVAAETRGSAPAQ